MKQFTEIYTKKTCLFAQVFGPLSGAANIFFLTKKITDSQSYLHTYGLFLMCAIISLVLISLLFVTLRKKRKSQEVQNEKNNQSKEDKPEADSKEKTYNNEASLSSQIQRLIVGTIFTFYPPIPDTQNTSM